MAVAAGANAVGLVSVMPSGPGVIPESMIAAAAAEVPAGVATYLLTSLTEVDAIVAQHRRCRTTTIQLVDRLAPGAHAHLREALPGVALVQVVHVTGPASVDEAMAVADQVDAILLDSGNPNRQVKELGGTGRVHDWWLSAEIRAAVPVPVLLAGGLRADNIQAAIAQVRPWGVDLCSGVRTGGRLDQAKLNSFMAQVRRMPS